MNLRVIIKFVLDDARLYYARVSSTFSCRSEPNTLPQYWMQSLDNVRHVLALTRKLVDPAVTRWSRGFPLHWLVILIQHAPTRDPSLKCTKNSCMEVYTVDVHSKRIHHRHWTSSRPSSCCVASEIAALSTTCGGNVASSSLVSVKTLRHAASTTKHHRYTVSVLST